MTEPRSIYQRIADAYVDIAASTFVKDGTVNPGTRNAYNFIPIGQMLNIVRQAHAKNGIITFFSEPRYNEDQHESRYNVVKESSYDGKKTTWVYANGHMDVRIIGADGDMIETTVPCEACDNSDKLNNKLLTNAERSLYRSLYSIDEGSPDPETENIENTTSAEPKAEPKPEPKVVRRSAPADDPFFSKKPKESAPTTERTSPERKKLLINDILDAMLGVEEIEELVMSQVQFYGQKKLEDCDVKALESIRDQIKSLEV